jgi:DNA-directed RNA polymerase alpha subunit
MNQPTMRDLYRDLQARRNTDAGWTDALASRSRNSLRAHFGREPFKSEVSAMTDKQLYRLPNFGRKCLQEVRARLNQTT